MPQPVAGVRRRTLRRKRVPAGVPGGLELFEHAHAVVADAKAVVFGVHAVTIYGARVPEQDVNLMGLQNRLQLQFRQVPSLRHPVQIDLMHVVHFGRLESDRQVVQSPNIHVAGRERRAFAFGGNRDR